MQGLEAFPVHLKCFLSPMSEAATVREQLEKFFAPDECPPYSLMEWDAPLIEIEVEATGSGDQARANGKELEFITPAGMTASPVYARVVRVPANGPLIYTRGFLAAESALASPDAELRDTFTQLRDALAKTGADFRSLVKATYYVSGADVNKRHNEIRPEFYDPKRPPAASKAMVKSLGIQNRRYTMDLIAVPK
jgi:enamine deaminase RidA (YjgF/YER057c/UK114 family)